MPFEAQKEVLEIVEQAEIADGLSPLKSRQNAANIIHALENSEIVRVIHAAPELFRKGLNLYESRPDKSWSLTDCISFIIINEKIFLRF